MYPCEDAVKTVEKTTEALEYYINLVDKAVAGFEKMGSNFGKKSCTEGKILSKIIVCYKKHFMKEESTQQIAAA